VIARDDPPRSPAPLEEPAPAAPGGLEAGEGRFHVLVDAIQDYAVFMLDPRGHITSWNTGAQRLKGYTEAEILGAHFSRFYPPEDVARGAPAAALRRAAAGHFQQEGWRVRRDGSRFWAEVTITAVRDAGGALLGFAKVTHDLTERHAAEEALRRSEERFRLLVEGVVDYAVFMLDPQGFVLSWNTGAQRLKGYTEAEILGAHFSRFYPPEDVASGKPQRVLAEAFHVGRFEEEGWRVRRDGSRFWAGVVITALRDATGTLRGFGKVTRDLTDRRRAEDERLRRVAAEEAARLRGEFLSVAAHELKTPLTSLRGMAQLTLRRYARDGDLAPERVGQALTLIDAQAGKLARLVEQLLDLSRVEAGRLRLEQRDTDLGALVANVADMFRARGDGDRIQLDAPVPAGHVQVDALRLEQVLTNLIDNALKYSPPGSPVRVRVSRPSGTAGLAPGAGPGRVRVTVTDRGPGVPLEDRPHLFGRFFRSRATEATAGMGLGLYVSRQIVELHGGTIRADFPPAGGTRIVVDLPTTAPLPEASLDQGASPDSDAADVGRVRER
jgi:PAS domain S-box-containing protein